MFFSELESKLMGEFQGELDAHPKSLIKMKLQDGTELIASFDTCYESDNDLEMDDEGYEEFYSYVFEIIKVLSVKEEDSDKYRTHSLFEVNYHTLPIEMSFI